ncbi:MAG TPA: energy-coupling factor transporter ATPase [bacterium]|nr:energy-coupling factor transporter ATPase [bacterium]
MAGPLIVCEDLHFSYAAAPESGGPAAPSRPGEVLRGVSLRIDAGEYVAIVGPNGSGKSTLARHLNALLRPTAGRVLVAGLDTGDPAHTRAIRGTVGMVFQHPESQMVATIVEEDVAFGPENLGVPYDELRVRVREALELVGMWHARERPPHLLSAGQKQRVAIASVLAMRPACVVLDEATSMLDPEGREAVAGIVGELRRRGTAVIAITHLMNEAARADRIVVLADGAVLLDGPPRRVFAGAELLRDVGLDLPPVTAVAVRVRAHVPEFPIDVLSVDELAAAVAARARGRP